MRNPDYGLASRWLHRLALGNRTLAEMAFELELATSGARPEEVAGGQHVFVSGLARAGTTVLMRELHRTGEFRSLTYRDMPFVLAPNLWRRISGASRTHAEARERAHGDGLLVDYDSPEALEEVFWRVFAGPAYLQPDRLLTMSTGPELQRQFQQYVAILLTGQVPRRYLSKNNNNILRLPGIQACFPNAGLLLPFREPLAHATSLLQQHQRFSEGSGIEPFTRQYISWLVHHEFGAEHRPFSFPGQLPLTQSRDSLDYWLQTWLNVYRWLDQSAPVTACWFAYERFCTHSNEVWLRLLERLQLPASAPPVLRQPEPAPLPTGVDPQLLDSARVLYSRLLERAL